MSIHFLLGVDGGGTSCRARLEDRHGRILGESRGGTANPRTGIRQAWDNIMQTCLEACRQGQLSSDDMQHVRLGLGLAGTNQSYERQLILSQPHPFGETCLLTDAHTACLGAFNGGEGGIVILGTGSCAVSFIAQRFHLFGGWGFPISDQASGAWLGLHLVSHALAALDHIQPSSPLAEQVAEHFGQQRENFVTWQNQALPRDYASFAPWIYAAARQHDPLALELIQHQVEWIERFVRQLLHTGCQQVALMGGLAEAVQPWLPPSLLTYLAIPQADALAGAILMARQQLGYRP